MWYGPLQRLHDDRGWAAQCPHLHHPRQRRDAAAGAESAAVIEKSEKIGGYGVHAAKLRRAGVPIFTGSTVVRASGVDSLQTVQIDSVDAEGKPIPGTERILEADTLCLSVGMSPLTELVWQAGAAFDYVSPLGGFVPVHDSGMQTSVSGLYVAGDVTGIEEAPIAMEERRLAGISTAEAAGRIDPEKAGMLGADTLKRISMLESGENGESRKIARHRQLSGMRTCCRKEC